MPRRSSESAVIPMTPEYSKFLEPPECLSEDELALWKETIGLCGWITIDMAPIALAYCRSAAMVNSLWDEVKAETDIQTRAELQTLYRAEVKLLSALARSLRLTAQTRTDAKTVRSVNDKPGLKPWQGAAVAA